MASHTESSITLGQHMVTAGLFIQVIFFGLFIIVACLFHHRISRSPTTTSQQIAVKWERHLIILYIGSGLILFRSIFRIIEYIQGFNGYILGHEIFLYIFDGVLMLSMMVLFNVWHPGQMISGRRKGSEQYMESGGSHVELPSVETK
jgi:hypothetical protein